MQDLSEPGFPEPDGGKAPQMPFIVWNDRLSVGVGVLDEDHKRLVGVLNDLYDAIRAGRGKETLGRLLDQLADYTLFHFRREEEFFAQTGYAGAVDHKAEHDNFAAWITKLRTRYVEGTAAAPSLEVINYLKDWLFDHILGSDQLYGAHLNEMGIR
jgi:hemerythrin